MDANVINELQNGLSAAYINGSVAANLAYKPAFVSNNPEEGKKVISSVEDELLRCDQFQISVAFITMGGVTPLLQTLKELEKKGVKGQILTTNYLNFSEPRALEKLNGLKNITLKMYDVEAAGNGFHTKGCRRPLMGRMLKEEENLTGKVKGKIVIEKNIRSNTMHGRNDRFYCQYLRFSDDIIENQILKAALRKAKRFIVDYFGDYSKDNNNYASMISYCSNALRHISDIQCSGTACNGLKFSGCYTYYKPVMAMARMVLDDISVESNGEISTTGYIVPYAISMEKLFEVYVRAYLKKNGIESYRSKSDKGIRLEKYDNKTDVFMEEEGLSNPGKYISGSIKPDLILTDRESGETVVFDVKYKDYTNGDSRNDRLQLLAYSMMMNANNVGIILPTHVDVEIFDARRINSMENRIVKYHQMLLGIMKDNPTIADYIKDNTFEKKE